MVEVGPRADIAREIVGRYRDSCTTTDPRGDVETLVQDIIDAIETAAQPSAPADRDALLRDVESYLDQSADMGHDENDLLSRVRRAIREPISSVDARIGINPAASYLERKG